jgi:hypothetical protein
MTEQELFRKNLELSNEFTKYLIAHPELEKQIPADAQIVFELEDDPDLTKRNLELAKAQRETEQPVIIIKVKGLLPENASRLIEPHLEVAK